MKHSVSHDLGQEKAKQVAEAAFKSYSERYSQYSPTYNWVSDNKAQLSFSVKGMKLNGVAEVHPNSIDMDLDVPFVLRPFKGKALDIIEKEIKSWIVKAKDGAL